MDTPEVNGDSVTKYPTLPKNDPTLKDDHIEIANNAKILRDLSQTNESKIKDQSNHNGTG